MLTSVAFAFALCAPAAPVPKDAPKTAVAGVAPRIVELKPNNEGKIVVQVRRTETVKALPLPAGANAPRAVERTVNRIAQVELSEVKDLKVMTAGGKSVELKEALEKLKDGGIVVMTNDGKPVDVAFLRVLKDDTLVFTSPELIGTGVTGFTSSTGGVIRAQPVPLPINPGNGAAPGIQIQILPGIIEVEAPPAAPAPAPAPEKK
jgi:riboflavin biosynthesis pyrimidine reductase